MGQGPPTDITDFIVGIAARLPAPSLREKVFDTPATIMSADGAVNNLEKNTLGAGFMIHSAIHAARDDRSVRRSVA